MLYNTDSLGRNENSFKNNVFRSSNCLILVLFFLGNLSLCSHLQQVKDDVRAPAEYEDEYDDEGHLDRLDLGLGDEAAGGGAPALGGGRGGGGRGGHRACAVVAAV